MGVQVPQFSGEEENLQAKAVSNAPISSIGSSDLQKYALSVMEISCSGRKDLKISTRIPCRHQEMLLFEKSVAENPLKAVQLDL
jgi:hypothetical protein